MFIEGTKVYFQRHPLWNDPTWYKGIVVNVFTEKTAEPTYAVSAEETPLNFMVTADRLKIRED